MLDYRFNVCDLNAIETRVGAWFAGCTPLLKVFEEHRDPYLDFASKMTGIPYDALYADYKGKNGRERQIAAKRLRQLAKPAVLGAIYRLSGGGWGRDENGDRIKTGLWGYAEGMGVEMDLKQAHELVKIFREAYLEIPMMWKMLEVSASEVLLHPKTVRYLGPNDCVKMDKITIADRDPLFRIQLPSGRYLHYMDSSIQNIEMPWKRKEKIETPDGIVEKSVPVFQDSFTYYGTDQETKQWSMIKSHGGKIFENIVQAISRDVLADKLIEFEEKEMPVVGHVHDEGVCQVLDDIFSPTIEDMIKIMSKPVSWAPSLPLGADGFQDNFYHK